MERSVYYTSYLVILYHRIKYLAMLSKKLSIIKKSDEDYIEVVCRILSKGKVHSYLEICRDTAQGLTRVGKMSN